MGELQLRCYGSARDLPAGWGECLPHLFLRAESLALLEEVNPCRQHYYLLEDNSGLSGAVTYRLKMDLFTFSKWSWKLPMTIVGMPLSVSKSGYSMAAGHRAVFFKKLAIEKGWQLVLNAADEGELADWTRGETLATCVLAVEWRSFNEYLASLRSPYRHRIGKALRKWTGVRMVELADPKLFDKELYRLYLQVYEKSAFKLERLSIDFFRRFPAKVVAFYHQDTPLGFIQLAEEKRELIFLLGGFDYQLNLEYDIYWNMLLTIVKLGIERHYDTIELGQTAEETKLKLGGTLQPKYLYIRHTNPLINRLLRYLMPYFSYRRPGLKFRVFKETL